MHADRKKWNDKYRRHGAITDPSHIVKTHFGLSRRGHALDIAAGTGRNAVFLAKHGFSVEAVDISDVGLGHLSGSELKITPICADLDTFDIPPSRYDLVLNIRFCHRRLFPLIIEGLKIGGVLIFESYLEDSDEKGQGPTCRDYLLRKNELLHAFLDLHILYYKEGTESGRKNLSRIASLVGVKKAD